MSNAELELESISPHVVKNVSISMAPNFGGIALKNFLVAVDGGVSHALAHEFRKKLENVFNLPVKYFILTHFHSDHRRGAVAFKDCKFVCSKKTVEIMPKSFDFTPYNVVTFENKHILEDQDYQVEIYHVGGHTAGSSFVYFPQDRIVFAGDIIFEQYVHITFMGAKWNFDDWIAALELMNTLAIDRIIPGHGPILSSKKELNKHLELYHTLRSVVKDAIKENKNVGTIELPKLEYIEEIKRKILNAPPNLQKEYSKAFEKGKQQNLAKLYKFYMKKKV